jgi:SecD/SecF fusion protein
LVNADNRKANSDADFITLFIEEYRKLEPTRPLATLFAAASAGKIDIKSSDDAVKKYIRSQASEAFETTFDRLTKRIDQFGVAQPNINKNPEKEIINIDLPGVKDKERVRANLQSTADLEFWELYTAGDANYADAWNKTFEAFNKKYGGVVDSTKKADSTTRPDSLTPKQPNDSGTAQNLDNDTNNTVTQTQTTTTGEKVTLDKFLEPSGFASYGKSKEVKIFFLLL